jgi:hypothetical protein
MNNKEYFYKVRYGFSSMDFVSVKNEEVEKAIYAQTKKIPVKLGNSYINGSNIISITPHYQRYTGWYDSYEPTTGDDWKQIERDCPKGFDQVLSFYQENVRGCIQQNNLTEIGRPREVPLIEPKELNGGGVESIGDLIKK